MKIKAATLAGGEMNQDYYAYGDTYALVLDGASSFLSEQTSIDAATYVKALGESLAAQLEYCEVEEIPEVVATAIEEVVKKYELVEESSPNSTIVIVKWNQNEVVTYVLGDSSCLIIEKDGYFTEITDNRMNKFGESVRKNYRERLSLGFGFDECHKKLLRKLQRTQKKFRNTNQGYWIAGTSPKAASFGLFYMIGLPNTMFLILATDGGMNALRSDELISLDKLRHVDLKKTLQRQHERETKDSNGKRYPRSKIHDDKTLILIDFQG